MIQLVALSVLAALAPAQARTAQRVINLKCGSTAAAAARPYVFDFPVSVTGQVIGSNPAISLHDLQGLIARQPVSLSDAMQQLLSKQALTETAKTGFLRYAAVNWYGLSTTPQWDAYRAAYTSPHTYENAVNYVYRDLETAESRHGSYRCSVRVPGDGGGAFLSFNVENVPFAWPLTVTAEGQTALSYDPRLSQVLSGLFSNQRVKAILNGDDWPTMLSGYAGRALPAMLQQPSKTPKDLIQETFGADTPLQFYAWTFDRQFKVTWVMMLPFSTRPNSQAAVYGDIVNNVLVVDPTEMARAKTQLNRVESLQSIAPHIGAGDSLRIFPISDYDEGKAPSEVLQDEGLLGVSSTSGLPSAIDGAYVIELVKAQNSGLVQWILFRDGHLVLWKFMTPETNRFPIVKAVQCEDGELCALSAGAGLL
jgi:hypothetical protein